MNSIKFISTLVLCLLLINSAHGGAGEVCLQLPGHVSDGQVSGQMGHPGRRGPIGPSGLKGEKGEVVRCRCHSNEVAELREEIRNFNRRMGRRLNEAIEQFNRKREIDCDVPNSLSHGSISSHVAKIPLDGRLTYNCDDGYGTAVQGTSDAVTVTCQSDSSWSGEIRCNRCATLGFEDGRIADNQITASSSHNSYSLPHYARLNNQRVSGSHAGSWLPSSWTAGEWIQLNLQSPHRVSGIITQGYPAGNSRITTYKISYGNSTSDMNIIQENNNDKIFQGNTAGRTNTVTNRFSPPISATYFRLIVQTWYIEPILRMEFLTC